MLTVYHMNTEAVLKGLDCVLLLETKFLPVHIILCQLNTNQ